MIEAAAARKKAELWTRAVATKCRKRFFDQGLRRSAETRMERGLALISGRRG